MRQQPLPGPVKMVAAPHSKTFGRREGKDHQASQEKKEG